jgi:aminopeptidase-like protein
LENNKTYLNLNPKCELQLGKRGLYDAIGGTGGIRQKQLTMLWVLNLSDGKHSLLDISEKSNLEISLIKKVVDILLKHNLLKLKT